MATTTTARIVRVKAQPITAENFAPMAGWSRLNGAA